MARGAARPRDARVRVINWREKRSFRGGSGWITLYCRACPYLFVCRYIYIYIYICICMFIIQRVHGRFYGLDLRGNSRH